jgi:hypothetical protein
MDLGEIDGHLFANTAGVGFDAHIASRFAVSRRRGFLGYAGITNNLDNGSRADTPYGKNPLVRQAFDAAIVDGRFRSASTIRVFTAPGHNTLTPTPVPSSSSRSVSESATTPNLATL